MAVSRPMERRSLWSSHPEKEASVRLPFGRPVFNRKPDKGEAVPRR